jgi:hypothetical protein
LLAHAPARRSARNARKGAANRWVRTHSRGILASLAGER